MNVTGRFIGSTSCGFVSGNVYRIKIGADGPYISVRDIHGSGYCPYRSIATLSQNWEIPPSKDVVNVYPVGNHVGDD